jgi:hypothetical protein
MRIQIPQATHAALMELAARDRRDARAQAEVILIRSLHELGLVTADGMRPGPRPTFENDKG